MLISSSCGWDHLHHVLITWCVYVFRKLQSNSELNSPIWATNRNTLISLIYRLTQRIDAHRLVLIWGLEVKFCPVISHLVRPCLVFLSMIARSHLAYLHPNTVLFHFTRIFVHSVKWPRSTSELWFFHFWFISHRLILISLVNPAAVGKLSHCFHDFVRYRFQYDIRTRFCYEGIKICPWLVSTYNYQFIILETYWIYLISGQLQSIVLSIGQNQWNICRLTILGYPVIGRLSERFIPI